MNIRKRLFGDGAKSSTPSNSGPTQSASTATNTDAANKAVASNQAHAESLTPKTEKQNAQAELDLKDAAASGNPELVKVALLGSPDVNESGGISGFTALHHAVAGTDSEARALIVELLHKAGADLEKKDAGKGLTPLHYTALRNKPLCMKALLACGANVNALEGNGATPLHGAAFYNYPDIARILLAHGADPEMKDQHGYSPLFLARRKGYQELIDLFEEFLSNRKTRPQEENAPDESVIRQFEEANRYARKPEEVAKEILEAFSTEVTPKKSISANFTIYPPRGLSIFDLLAYQGKSISYRGTVIGRADKVDVKTNGSVVITVNKIDEALACKELGLDLVLRD